MGGKREGAAAFKGLGSAKDRRGIAHMLSANANFIILHQYSPAGRKTTSVSIISTKKTECHHEQSTKFQASEIFTEMLFFKSQ